MFARYAADPEVTRLLAWPRHRSVEDTERFLEWSEAEWRRWPVGPYLIEDRVTSGPRIPVTCWPTGGPPKGRR